MSRGYHTDWNVPPSTGRTPRTGPPDGVWTSLSRSTNGARYWD